MAETLTSTLNVSGQLYTKTDETTRFLDAIYMRGKNGGRVQTRSIEFVLSSGYDMNDPTQPNISEVQSMTAPTPETTERTQEYNVTPQYHRSVRVSYLKQSNVAMLSGVNNAGQANNVPNELDFQIGRRVAQIRMDLNHTLINGVYQYTKGSTTVASRSRGLLAAIQSNRFNNGGNAITKNLINDAVKNSIANGADPTGFEIWVNPSMLDVITDLYALIPGTNQPATRTEGGIAYNQILTPYAPLNIMWEPVIPNGNVAFFDIGKIAVAEMPYIDENGVNHGVLFYESLAKTGAAESGQIYGNLGTDYGAEWHHALITNILV
jgi:hypothetical protein